MPNLSQPPPGHPNASLPPEGNWENLGGRGPPPREGGRWSGEFFLKKFYNFFWKIHLTYTYLLLLFAIIVASYLTLSLLPVTKVHAKTPFHCHEQLLSMGMTFFLRNIANQTPVLLSKLLPLYWILPKIAASMISYQFPHPLKNANTSK